MSVDTPTDIPAVIGELVTEADIGVLNRALVERGIAAERIITILPIEPPHVGSVEPPRYRVLYRLV